MDMIVDAVLPAQLYEAYAEDGALLYVGVATNLASRLTDHQRTKPWWPEVVRVKARSYATRTAALKAERAMITKRTPRYNVTHSTVNIPAPAQPRAPMLNAPTAGGRVFEVVLNYESKLWMVTIPEIDGLTQARTIKEAHDMAREYIAVTLDIPADSFDIHVRAETIGRVEHVTQLLEDIRIARIQAEQLEREAADKSRHLAAALAAEDLPLREIGAVMGVSHQRADQLVRGSTHGDKSIIPAGKTIKIGPSTATLTARAGGRSIKSGSARNFPST